MSADRSYMLLRSLSVRLTLVVLVALLCGPLAGRAAAQEADVARAQEPFDSVEWPTPDHARLLRLYWAYFDREPDADGASYWFEQLEGCLSLHETATWFTHSSEFTRRYGSADDATFVHRVYGNVLGREPDEPGLAYWRGLLAEGDLDRAGVVLNVSLSAEFISRHRYDFDDAPARSCETPSGQRLDRLSHVFADPVAAPLVALADPSDPSEALELTAPAAVIDRIGFHQSTHPGALPLESSTVGDAATPTVRSSVMASRGRGTALTGAADIAVEPATTIVAPISGTVARAGTYRLYCRYDDGYVVINPDARPELEVKLLHVQGVAVAAGQRVEAGQTVAAHATTFPFRSQLDALTAEPSWPHVHIEVVDPSIPRPPSTGGGC